MKSAPARPSPVPPAPGELEALAAATAAATARARRGELATLIDLAERIERMCAGLAADGGTDRLRAQLIGLADELEALTRELERGRGELATELARGAARLVASRAYAPAGDERP